MSATKRMSTDSVMKIGLAVIVIVLVVLGWVSAFLGELLTPTGMPWTDFSALSAKSWMYCTPPVSVHVPNFPFSLSGMLAKRPIEP